MIAHNKRSSTAKTSMKSIAYSA